MADPKRRLASNAPGAFYVDEECIECDLCREHAPATFSRDDTIGKSRVYQQPESAADVALAQEAIELCPVEAIGWDACTSVAEMMLPQTATSSGD